MMTEPVLALWIAAALFAAMAVGWLLAGFWRWLCLGTHCERARIAELVEQAHDAEEARETAEAARAEAEARLAEREATLTARISELRATSTAALAERDEDLRRALSTAEEEARTAWDGLSGARRRIGELEREIEALRRGERA